MRKNNESQGLPDEIQIQTVRSIGFQSKLMKHKSPNNKEMTYGAGFKPFQQVRNMTSGRMREPSPGKDTSPKKLVSKIDFIKVKNRFEKEDNLTTFGKAHSPHFNAKSPLSSPKETPLSIRGHEIYVNSSKQGMGTSLKIIV